MKWMYPGITWNMPVEKGEKILYLTFDDGPHPIATTFVLDQLKQFDAKATFFCIGRNVVDHAEVYKKIIDEGHVVGNHTFNHLNGWRTKDDEYVADVLKAATVIDSGLFRPPYGRITRFQSAILRKTVVDSPQLKLPSDSTLNLQHSTFNIIMWSVLSADWDNNIDGKKCYENIVLNAKSGSIVVFHDSAKALERMQFALPKVLEYYAKEGYTFKSIQQ
jgi:peptidoglycan-N-acetylglucosamine deacetylase